MLELYGFYATVVTETVETVSIATSKVKNNVLLVDTSSPANFSLIANSCSAFPTRIQFAYNDNDIVRLVLISICTVPTSCTCAVKAMRQ